MNLNLRLKIFLTFIMVMGLLHEACAQTYTETFGQNRVQTRKYDWLFFDTEHFRIYHYDAAGRHLARYVAEQAERDIKVVEKKMGGKFPHRFNIILYNNFDEYQQTNVGRKYDSQIQDIPAGTVDLVGDRLVVYFTGIHTDVRRQLRSGMSRVVMERMIFGDSFREMVKNAVLLNLPAWTTNGFIAYLVDGWDTQTETNWKNLLQANPNKGFYELAEREPELAGKAFWKFISDNYGESTVKNLLLGMQQKSSLEQGLMMTIGLKLRPAFDSVKAYYAQVYEKDALVQEHPDSIRSAVLEIDVPADNTEIRNIRLSPRGFDAAYVAWKDGEFKVYIQHTTGDQGKAVIVAGGVKDYNESPDPQYPLLAWSNSGYKLAVLYKKGRQTRLRIYNSIKAKVEDYVVPSTRFDRVLGMSFMEDDNKLVFSAIKKSKTDLYQFTIRGSRVTPITNDAWDDIQPWFVSGGSRRGILFLSNRPVPNLNVPIKVNELPTGPMNVYFFDTKTGRPELLRVSSITKGRISQPIQYGSENFAYLYDENGIVNRYVVLLGRDANNMDSAYALPMTNYTQSIISHQYNPASDQVADVVQVGNKYKIYFGPLQIPSDTLEPKTLVPAALSVVSSVAPQEDVFPNTIIEDAQVSIPQSILKTGNIFQSEFENEEEERKADSLLQAANDAAAALDDSLALSIEVDSILVDSTYVKMRPQPYRLSFKPDFFTVRMDNSILFNKYQSLTNNINTPISGMVTVSLDDAMEDHRFTGGIRIPTNFSGLTWFLQYENFKRRIDWSLLYLRTENKYKYDVRFVDTSGNVVFNKQELGKSVTNLIQGSASYPLDRRRSVALHMAFRQDVINFLATDTINLTFLEKQFSYWNMTRAEYIYDNTLSPALNIRYGLRYKFFAEYFYKLSSPNGGFYNFGLDIRNYQKLYRHVILASRLAYAHSGGNQKIKYVLGGVDNWLFPQTSNLPTPGSQDFAFQALATNLRGYQQNARSGNSYGVANIELRAPIFTTFMRKPIQSSFLKNLQAVGFVDIGSAWNGFIPNEDPDNNYIFTGQYVQVAIPYSLPAGIGYGAGLRTMLFGYFMRLDAAWNIEGRRKPIWYFSIGTDF